jgi:hypothetical protein
MIRIKTPKGKPMIIARTLKGKLHDQNKTTMRTLGLEQEK